MNVLLTTTGSDTLSAHFWTPLPPLRNLSFSNPTSRHRALPFLKHGHSTHTSQVQTPALGQCTPLTPSQMHLLLKPTTSFCTGFLSASLPVHTDLVRYCNLSGLPRSCTVSERGSLMEPHNMAWGKPSAPLLLERKLQIWHKCEASAAPMHWEACTQDFCDQHNPLHHKCCLSLSQPFLEFGLRNSRV